MGELGLTRQGWTRAVNLTLIFLAGSLAAGKDKGTVDVVPSLQFVREGRSVIVKVRTNGERDKGGWNWEIVEPSQGILEPIDECRVRFTATNALPWTTLHIRATSLHDSKKVGEAVVEVLPSPVFSTVENILGPAWLCEHALQTKPIRIGIKGPGYFSWSGRYTITAELDSYERDRFQWSITPDIGTIQRIQTTISCSEKIKFKPMPGRKETVTVRVSVQNLENPAHYAVQYFDIPPDKEKATASTAFLFVPGMFGAGAIYHPR